MKNLGLLINGELQQTKNLLDVLTRQPKMFYDCT